MLDLYGCEITVRGSKCMDQMYLLLGPLRKAGRHRFHRFRLQSPSLVIEIRAWLELPDIRTMLGYQWAGCMIRTCTNLLRCP